MKRTKQIATAVLCLILLLLCGTGTASAKAKRTVRVAFFPMEGYHMKRADGSLAGMDVEYMDALRKYAGWDVEFVECGSWDEALRFLSEKKVDLVGTAQYSAQRAAVYQYADLSSGYTFGTIATTPDSPLAYEDFDAMKNITFGMVKTYIRRAEFLQYLADNGIASPKLREYDSTPDLQAALESGEVDAMVHTFMEIKEGQRLIGRFAPRPFYYITYPGNDDVMRELNYAIADLKMNEPVLETKLMNEFFQSRLDKTVVFTNSEKNYAAETEEIVAGYTDSHYPFLYTDESGECRGLTRDLLEGAASIAGISVTWKKVEPATAYDDLKNGAVDLITYCSQAVDEIAGEQFLKLNDYVEIPLVLVMNKSSDLGSLNSLATVSYLEEEAGDVMDGQDVAIMLYNEQRDCMDALQSGKVDAVLCDSYLAEYLLSSELRYHSLEIKRALSNEHGISMTVRSGDTELASILNKTLLMIDDRAVSDYMLERNIYNLTSVSQFIQDHSAAIIILLLLIIIGVVLVTVHIIRDTRKIQKLMYKDVDVDIWNLNHLIYWGKRMLTQEKKRQQIAVAYLNISQFQRYKVVYGWDNAQNLMAAIADVLTQCVHGKGEICAKADGDHFVLLLTEESGEITDRLKNIGMLVEEYIYHATGNRIDIQMGIYFLPPDSIDLHEAIICANQAIDFVSGDEKIKIFDADLEQAIKDRHEKQKLLDSISIEDHFTTYYQAKVDVRTEKVVGAEALIRFIDPSASGKVISPGFFVPYYEQTGRVTEIDFFVLHCVCAMLRKRLDKGENVVTVSCNFSRIHFTKPDFVERLIGVLEEYDIPKELIEVEVTETLVMEEMQQKIAEQTMDDLHAKDIRLSIDDFGSGYSSLGVIEKIPASVIKLDRSFLLNNEDRERQIKIMKRIVDLAEDLGAQIVCEGVETEEDVELMHLIGAHIAQGYRYARPVPEMEFTQRLSDNR